MTRSVSDPGRLARHLLSPGPGAALRAWFARPFSRRNRTRVAIYYSPNRISFSQLHPFLYYQQRFREAEQAEIRAVPIDTLLTGARMPLERADVILVQPWFTVDPDRLTGLLERLGRAAPAAPITFLDSYAHSDLRLGRHLEPHVRHYVKKSLFRDHSLYLRAWRGDTNLTEYYGDLYGIEADPVDWQTPPALLERLHLGPNFFTDPRFLDDFITGVLPPRDDRPIDVHARMASKGSGWYQAMRADSLARLGALPDLTIAAKGTVPLKTYMAEMGQSKLCFSPFGYGELCWRDIEAIRVGAVLIKPDMGHLETHPELYEPGVTYLPVRWDFADLEEVIRGALADEARCRQIAATAWARISGYLREARFVDDMGFLFRD